MNIAPIQTYQGPKLDLMGNYSEGREAFAKEEEHSRKAEAREKMQGILSQMGDNPNYEAAALQMLPLDPEMANNLLQMETHKQTGALNSQRMQANSLEMAEKKIEQRREQIALEVKAAKGATAALEGVEDPAQKEKIYDLYMKTVQDMGLEVPEDLRGGWSPENEQNLKDLAELGQQMIDLDPRNQQTAEIKNYEYSKDNLGFSEFYSEANKTSRSPEMQAWEQFKLENPGVPYATFMSQYRKGITGAALGGDGTIQVIDGAKDAVTGISKADEAGKQEAQTEAIGDKAAEELKAEKLKMKPKTTAAYKATMAKSANVSAKIQAAIPEVSGWTAGILGDTFKAVPGTPAADLQANLKTIKANLGFEALQEMRNNSPTGGALGSIAVQELEALQATWQNVEQSQSPEQLKANLEQLDKDILASRERIQAAYEQDYGDGSQDTNSPDIEAKRARLEELRRKAGR